jgi:hypothetical protein
MDEVNEWLRKKIESNDMVIEELYRKFPAMEK